MPDIRQTNSNQDIDSDKSSEIKPTLDFFQTNEVKNLRDIGYFQNGDNLTPINEDTKENSVEQVNEQIEIKPEQSAEFQSDNETTEKSSVSKTERELELEQKLAELKTKEQELKTQNSIYKNKFDKYLESLTTDTSNPKQPIIPIRQENKEVTQEFVDSLTDEEKELFEQDWEKGLAKFVGRAKDSAIKQVESLVKHSVEVQLNNINQQKLYQETMNQKFIDAESKVYEIYPEWKDKEDIVPVIKTHALMIRDTKYAENPQYVYDNPEEWLMESAKSVKDYLNSLGNLQKSIPESRKAPNGLTSSATTRNDVSIGKEPQTPDQPMINDMVKFINENKLNRR